MSDRRRARIKSIAESKAASGEVTQAVAKKFATYWLTRETRLGNLSPNVLIWLAKPSRHVHVLASGGEVISWMAFHEDGSGALYGKWTVAQAQTEAGNGVPSNDRECLRVG